MWLRLLLRQYLKVYRISNWMRWHFTHSGHVVLAFTLASAVFGVNTKQTTTYQLFVFLAVLLVLAWLNSRFNRLKVKCSRQLPRYAMVGEPLVYQVTLNNLTGKAYDNLALIERLADTFPGPSQIRSHCRFDKRRWFKRWLSYRDWLGYLIQLRGGILPETALPSLLQTPLQLTLQMTPQRRGTMTFAGSFLAKPDSLGLFRDLIPLQDHSRCLVLPKSYPIKPLALPGQRQYQPGGITLASSVGNSSEFMALRDYRPGDSLNSIHWKSLAKHGKLIVKEYQDEYFVRRALLLDTFIGDAPAEQFEAAVSVAASIAVSERQHEALLDFMFAGLETYCFTSGRGVDQLPHLQEILAGVQASGEDNFERLSQAVLAHAALCSSVVCVLMHWDQARRDLLKRLLSCELPVAVFLLHDGNLQRVDCADQPAQFHLLDYRHLGEQLAAL